MEDMEIKDIKTSLKQLTQLFARHVGEQTLPESLRPLVAQFTVLAAHVDRLESRTAMLDASLAELANIVLMMREASQAAAAPVNQPLPAPAAPTATASTPMSEDDEAKSMAEKVLQETQAEMAAIEKQAAETSAAITPLRKPSKKTGTGDAA